MEWLVAFLAAVYLLECFTWVRLGTHVFASELGGRFSVRGTGGAVLRRGNRGLVLRQLFPWGSSFVAEPWAISLSPLGAYSYVSQAAGLDSRPEQEAVYVPRRGLRAVTVDQDCIREGAGLFVRLSSSPSASREAALLQHLAAVGDGEPEIRREIKRSLDAEAVRERIRAFRRATIALRTVATALFALVFVLVPVWLAGRLPVSGLALLAAFFALFAATTGVFFFTHRALHPTERGERWKQTLLLCASPADAMHASDHLARDFLVGGHPLAVGGTLLSKEGFVGLAGTFWRDLAHPIEPVCQATGDPLETERWFREEWKKAVEKFLRDQGNDPRALETAPTPENAAVSYCPRCLRQYQLSNGTCDECGGVGLVRFGATPSA